MRAILSACLAVGATGCFPDPTGIALAPDAGASGAGASGAGASSGNGCDLSEDVDPSCIDDPPAADAGCVSGCCLLECERSFAKDKCAMGCVKDESCAPHSGCPDELEKDMPGAICPSLDAAHFSFESACHCGDVDCALACDDRGPVVSHFNDPTNALLKVGIPPGTFTKPGKLGAFVRWRGTDGVSFGMTKTITVPADASTFRYAVLPDLATLDVPQPPASILLKPPSAGIMVAEIDCIVPFLVPD